MSIRVLIADDSAFYRRRLTALIARDADMEVVAAVSNGAEAVEAVARLDPDVVTMDVEMPVMDGIEAVRRIMQTHPRPILMFSSLTHEGARATLDALSAGATDFLPKNLQEIAADAEQARTKLCGRIRSLGKLRKRPAPAGRAATAHAVPATGALDLVVIGTSTGGPVALQKVLTRLPADFPLPVLVVQHMPGTFTTAFARRLDELCNVNVREAVDGDALAAGLVLVAPGGRQTLVRRSAAGLAVTVRPAGPGELFHPSADVTFSSCAETVARRALAIVLTGMGSDGCSGARLIREAGGTVWAQDEASCVVYGMPRAVVEAGIAQGVLALDEIGDNLVRAASGRQRAKGSGDLPRAGAG